MKATNSIPYINLKAQNRTIQSKIQKTIHTEITACDFILGNSVAAFEEAFARFCGVNYCIGVDNGTSALYLSLLALGVGPGDEVLTVANSFIATALAISHTGAKPVFLDCDDFYLMDVDKIEQAITSQTKVILPVHLYGLMADMHSIKQIADKYHLYVIEDAAQAHGAAHHTYYPGNLSDFACFSFYPTKNLGAYGDAGAVITNNFDLAEKIRLLRNYGCAEKYHHDVIGYNHRLDSLQAAILSVKLNYIKQWNARRNDIAKLYCRELHHCKEVVLPNTPPESTHAFHIFAIRTKDRNTLKRYLEKNGIETHIHYPIPIHKQKVYAHQYNDVSLPNTEQFAQEELSLPLFPEMKDEDVLYVTQTIKAFFKS